MAEISPKFGKKTINLQIHKAEQTSERIFMPRHIRVKPVKIKVKGNNLGSSQGEMTHYM